MAHFSLRNARFEEANTLYRVIATSRFWLWPNLTQTFTTNDEKRKQQKKGKRKICFMQRMPVYEINKRGLKFGAVLFFSFSREIYITNYGWSFHVLKKREPGRHFIIIFVVFLITSPLWIVIVCIVFYMICTWFSLLSLSNPSWMKLLEAYFFGGAVNKKVFTKSTWM